MRPRQLIGSPRARGPTSIYTPTPLPRVRQDGRALVIKPSRPPAPAYAVFPSRKWIVREPTLPNWRQLPRPLSTSAPKPPDLELAGKHLRTMKDPVARTDSPYNDPTVKGPRSKILARGKPQLANSESSHGKPNHLTSPAVKKPVLTFVSRLCSARQLRQQDQPPPWWCRVSIPPPSVIHHRRPEQPF